MNEKDRAKLVAEQTAALGTWFANVRQGTPEASSAAQSQQVPMPEAPAQQVVPQRNAKHH
jgi:hypothetical protein